jgi:hypothetical protein
MFESRHRTLSVVRKTSSLRCLSLVLNLDHLVKTSQLVRIVLAWEGGYSWTPRELSLASWFDLQLHLRDDAYSAVRRQALDGAVPLPVWQLPATVHRTRTITGEGHTTLAWKCEREVRSVLTTWQTIAQ